MKKSEAIAFFGSAAKVAAVLRVTRGAVSSWGDDLPPLRQYQLSLASNGALKVDPAYAPSPNEAA